MNNLPRALLAAATLLACSSSSRGDPVGVEYAIDDGSAERSVSIDTGEDTIWLNTFPVQAGGEVIQSISVSFGRPGLSQSLDGLPIKILLYEQADGTSLQAAVLKQSVDATTANANSLAMNSYPIPPTTIHGTLIAAVLFRNNTGASKAISSLDTDTPTLANRSFYGFASAINEADLSTIPSAQFGSIESLGQTGNWVLRANSTVHAAQ
jgi:hypothetical protein